MGHVRDQFHVEAPIESCWGLFIDPHRLTEWQVGLLEVKDISGPFDQVGSAYTSVLRFAGRKLEGRFEVTRVEKPQLLEFKGTAPGGGKASASTRLERAGSGTDITFEMDYELPGGIIGDIADRLFMERQIERDIKHGNENFKALCEVKVPAHA